MRTVVVALALAALAACSSGSNTGTPMPDSAAPVDGGPGYYVPAGYALAPPLPGAGMHSFGAAAMVLEAGKDYRAVIESDAGRMVLDLLEADTPITVNSFVFLARNQYFDGLAFHRVIAGFMAQTGDPNTLAGDRTVWGQGGPGYSYGLEVGPSLAFDGAGVVGMARTNDPNSNGSQFFITFAAQPSLNGMYTVFARVTEGADALPKIARGEPPANPSRMQRVYIVQKP